MSNEKNRFTSLGSSMSQKLYMYTAKKQTTSITEVICFFTYNDVQAPA